MSFEAHFCYNFYLNFETKRDMKLEHELCSTLNCNIY
jgi:hypothetical protein